MGIIIMLVAPFPIGYLFRSRMAGYLAYVACYSFVFTFQSTSMLKEWAGGDYSGFAENPATVDWMYALVNLALYAVGLGLVTVGYWVRTKRQRAAMPAVDLAK